MSFAEAKLAARALPAVLFYRAGLEVLPFPLLARICFNTEIVPRSDAPSPRALAEAVSRASSIIRKTTCLSRSLAAVAMLRSYGYPARLRVGVASDGTLRAHAWVELDGVTLMERSAIEMVDLADIEAAIS